MRRSESAYPKLGVKHAAVLAILGRPYRSRPQKPQELAALVGIMPREMLVVLAGLVQAGLAETTDSGRYRLSEEGLRLCDENQPDTAEAAAPAAFEVVG